MPLREEDAGLLRVAGFVNPHELLFARRHVRRVRDVAPRVHDGLNALDAAYAEIHRAHQRQPDGTDLAVAHWNSTEAYARIDGRWRLVHSHWSFVQPELKARVSEEG